MKKIYIVRHGETNWNLEGRTQGWKDSSLTEQGLQQAKQLAQRLKKEEIQVVFSSNLERATSTAHIIADAIKAPCFYLEDLKEVGFGHWEGLTKKEIGTKYPHQLEAWHNTPHIAEIPEGEGLKIAQNRICSLYNEILDREEENILLVSHGTLIKLFIMSFLNMPLADFYKLKQDNCAINIIEFTKYGSVLTKYNDTSFMEILKIGDEI